MHATIGEMIRRDLAERLGSGLGPPVELTLPALAKHYGVSVTPVREALKGLIGDGVLIKEDNGRVRVREGRVRAKRSTRARDDFALPSRSAELEAALAGELIARSLRGEADYLREEATAAKLGVGRTAIRQVFGRLAGRGLIVHVPRCGWRVRTFDEADLVAYLEIREVLELKALELARPRLDPAELRRMLAGNDPGGRPPRLENALHRYLVEKSDNDYIRDFFDRHGAYYTSLLDFAAPETCVVATMARQHRAILRALINGDWPRARKELAHHIRSQRPIVEELMRRIGRLNPTTRNPEGAP